MSTLSAGAPRDLALFVQKKFGLKEFLETGTFRGDSTLFAADLFDYVLTIELDDENWKLCQSKFEGHDPPIDLWHGDSAELIPGALRQLDHRSLIWLDAHNVAGMFGDEDACPVLDELAAINEDGRMHIILIDDAHCFHPPLPMHLTPDAWPTIDDIQAAAYKGGYEVHVAHDIVILAPPDDMKEILLFLASLPSAKNAIMRRFTCKAEAVNGPLRKGAVPATLPSFTGMAYTSYGWMLVHRFDSSQTAALTQLGISRDHEDIDRLSKYVKDAGYGAVFVDIGANIGCYAFGLRRYCAHVHAFEPQRIIFNMMAGSVALNGWTNVHCYNVALGEYRGQIEVPQFDYNKSLSFGSIEFGNTQREKLSQDRKYNKSQLEYVDQKPLDWYGFIRVDVMKIDVEGMELAVLAGAKDTIRRCRPIIQVEHLKSDKGALHAVLEDMGYLVQELGTIDFLCIPIP